MKCIGMVPNCEGYASMLDEKGYVYCAGCGLVRKTSGIRCRKLKVKEIKQLESGQPLECY